MIKKKLIPTNLIFFVTFIVTDTYPQNKNINKSVNKTNALLRKICQNKNISYIDLNRFHSKNKQQLNQKHSLDRIHLNGL